jgi:hypothetical protein
MIIIINLFLLHYCTVHLFIGTTHSLYIITFIPFTMNYNNDIEYTQNIMGL